MFGSEIGIDLGASTVRIYVRGRGIVLREPCVVTRDRGTGEILEVGTAAQRMLGRTPGSIEALRPLRDGIAADPEMTQRLLRAFLARVPVSKLFRPELMLCVPPRLDGEEARAVVDAGLRAGARRVRLIGTKMAAALGAGLEIGRPQGNMVIDIGGGTTDIAVLTMGEIVEEASVRIAGASYDGAIAAYLRRQYNLLIGERTAEELKVGIGCVYPRPEELTAEVRGRCLLTGMPRTVEVTSTELLDAVEEVTCAILDAIHGVLERTPPELAADIAANGAVLTGGGCLIWGFAQMLAERTGLPARIADDAAACVVCGAGKAMEKPEKYARRDEDPGRAADWK